MESLFPEVFNPTSYRNRYPDLKHLNDCELKIHYENYGSNEGRNASPFDDRKSFLMLLSDKETLLEIGVFDSPSLEFLNSMGRIVHYADYLDHDDLVQRAKEAEGRDFTRVPEIKWVLSIGYEQIDIKYDAVISHHCVEHQPDLVKHFLNIRGIVKGNGWYLFSLPDKRQCFDHFIPETNLVDVIDAYLLERRSPSFKSVLEHRCFTSHSYQDGVDPYERKDPQFVHNFYNALKEFSSSPYVDVHCWQFTPESFRILFNQLVDLKLLPGYRDLKIYGSGGEFYVALAF
jgi:SAM-dependent methyltransferase